MDAGADSRTRSRRRQRLLERLDRMVASGQVCEAEAQRLRAAETPSQFEDAERDIRVRHARSSLDAAVVSGRLTKEEAHGYIVRLRNGEHPRSLRAELRSLRGRSKESG